VQESLRGYMPKFYIEKTTDMVISPEEDIDILDIVDYLASVYDEKVYKFDGTCMITGDYTEEYRIWYCRDGFLVLRDSTMFWYPANYDSTSIQKDGMEIIETEDFRTPYFMLFPTRLTSYLLRMGQKGYKLLGDLDEYRGGDDHNNDIYKFQEA